MLISLEYACRLVTKNNYAFIIVSSHSFNKLQCMPFYYFGEHSSIQMCSVETARNVFLHQIPPNIF